MLQIKVEELEEKLLDKILVDAFYWLTDTFGDRSIELNKTPASRRNCAYLRRFFSKCPLTLVWDYNPCNLPWHHYDGQCGEYNTNSNYIIVHVNKKEDLAYSLDTLFHEYRHSQQSMYLYTFIAANYENHPLEKDAEEFAKEQVPIFWEKYKKKLAIV
jgi:hypothetical protein